MSPDARLRLTSKCSGLPPSAEAPVMSRYSILMITCTKAFIANTVHACQYQVNMTCYNVNPWRYYILTALVQEMATYMNPITFSIHYHFTWHPSFMYLIHITNIILLDTHHSCILSISLNIILLDTHHSCILSISLNIILLDTHHSCILSIIITKIRLLYAINVLVHLSI